MKKTQKILQHPILGPVYLKKNSRSKRITLRVKTDASIVVTLPQSVAYQAGEKMLNLHIDWVKEQVSKAKQQQQAQWLSWNSTFQLRHKQVLLKPCTESQLSVVYKNQQITIFIPNTWDLTHAGLQEKLQELLIELFREEAKQYLPQRTRQLAASKGIAIGHVRVKNVKTRWGSCSSKGNINLSLYLMLLPDKAIDYVIMHELAHIKHQNHSAAFWQHLEQLLPGALQLDQEMKNYSRPF